MILLALVIYFYCFLCANGAFVTFQLINKESLQQLVLEAESLVRGDIRNKTPNKSNYTKFMEIISQNSTKQNMQKDKDMKDKNKNKRVQV